MCAGGLEFVAVEAKAQEPAAEGVGGVVGLGPGRAGRAHAQGLEGNRHAELDVALYLPGVKCAVEGAELDRAFLPHRVEVEQVVPAGVVVAVCVVSPVGVVVPNLCQLLGSARLLPVQALQKALVNLAAPAAAALGRNRQGIGQQVFVCVYDVHQVPKGLRGVVAQPDVHVDAAGAVRLRARRPELPDELLHRFDVFPAANRGHELALVFVVRRLNRGVAFEGPLASLPVRYLPGAVRAADVSGRRAEVFRENPGRLFAAHDHLYLHTEGLVAHVLRHGVSFPGSAAFPARGPPGGLCPPGVAH